MDGRHPRSRGQNPAYRLAQIGKAEAARSGLRTSYGGTGPVVLVFFARRNQRRRTGAPMRTWPRRLRRHVANVEIAGSNPAVRTRITARQLVPADGTPYRYRNSRDPPPRPGGETGRRAGFRPRCPVRDVRVQIPPRTRSNARSDGTSGLWHRVASAARAGRYLRGFESHSLLSRRIRLAV